MTDERVEPTKEWLDGAPVGQVLTREILDEMFRETFKRDEAAKQDGCEQVSWVNGYATCGVSVRDALLAKFGAAPQVRECDHKTPDGELWREVTQWTTGDNTDTFYNWEAKFCPDCGQSLKGAGEK